MIALLDIRNTPLDVAEVLAAVEVPAAGGVSIFVGNVRDHDGGQAVGHLEYSEHPTALLRLREVAEEVAAVTKALTDRLAALAVELNDKAVKAAERRVAEVIRTAGEQREQSERELADASQTVEDLESKLDEAKAAAEGLEKRL
ncbi:MAG TPA: molybdenum cofactor biosynthesis protein MoaE, partial [Marmoricola sp.]|nr:molybdenum cofactor biosynthesis protein MoaE [Marmoricola sp.]